MLVSLLCPLVLSLGSPVFVGLLCGMCCWCGPPFTLADEMIVKEMRVPTLHQFWVSETATERYWRVLLFIQMVPGTGGVPQFQRIPLPGTEFLEEEPLYVNAKQYRRILKRRQARAKLEAEGRIPKERPVRKCLLLLLLLPLINCYFEYCMPVNMLYIQNMKSKRLCAWEICKYMCWVCM